MKVMFFVSIHYSYVKYMKNMKADKYLWNAIYGMFIIDYD